MPKLVIYIFGFLFLILSSSEEIAQWRGPNRDGIYPGKDLLKVWPEAGPELKLKIEGIGRGLSSPVVYKDHIFITGLKSDSLDVISAYDLQGSLI